MDAKRRAGSQALGSPSNTVASHGGSICGIPVPLRTDAVYARSPPPAARVSSLGAAQEPLSSFMEMPPFPTRAPKRNSHLHVDLACTRFHAREMLLMANELLHVGFLHVDLSQSG